MNQLTNLSAEISAQHEQDAKDLTRILPASKKSLYPRFTPRHSSPHA